MSTEVVDQIIPDFETAASLGLVVKYQEERMAKAAEFNQNLSYVIGRMRALMTSVVLQMQENQQTFAQQIAQIQAIVQNAPAAYDTLQKIGAELEKDNSTEGALFNAIGSKADINSLESALTELNALFMDMSNEINKLGASS